MRVARLRFPLLCAGVVAAVLVGLVVHADPLPAAVTVLDARPTNGALNLGGEDRLTVHKGDLVVNATHASAVFNANSQIEAKGGGVKVAGGYSPLGTATCTPDPETGAAAAEDPYARTAWPQPEQVVSRQKLFLSGADEQTLSPGYYHGGLSCTGNELKVRLDPGLYVITDGDFFAANCTLTGDGVTILMSGQTPGKLLFATDCKVNLSAPKEGPLKDLLLVSARTMQGNDTDLGFNGCTAVLDGVLYAPRGRVGVFFKAQVTAGAAVSWNLMLNTGGCLDVLGERQPTEARHN
jgi:hypothetical protein